MKAELSKEAPWSGAPSEAGKPPKISRGEENRVSPLLASGGAHLCRGDPIPGRKPRAPLPPGWDVRVEGRAADFTAAFRPHASQRDCPRAMLTCGWEAAEAIDVREALRS